jgi:NtrC-family two-component system sensor histidine kinase KinB
MSSTLFGHKKGAFTGAVADVLKYTARGGCVTLRVASGHSAGEGDGGTVQIAVTDTGPGVPEEYRERVFEKFFRVEHQRPAGANGVRGTGIGLYLCRQIVAAHGGRIWCEPGPGGRGARFAVELPRGT